MRKRLFTLCLALMAVTLGAMAAEELYVAGNKVTLSGTGTVTVSGGDIKSGSVKYDRDSKTLTLKNVTIERSGNNNRGIRSSVSGLTVVFSGKNIISTTSAAGLRFEASTTIRGSGTVMVKSNETALYVYKNTTVTIKGVDRNRLTLTLNGKYGIQGEDGNSSENVSLQRYVTLTASGSDNALKYLNNLTVSGDASVTLKGNDTNPTINSLASLTLTKGIVIDLPLGGMFDGSKKTVMGGSSTTGYTGAITINPAIVCIISENFPDFNFCTYILQVYPRNPIDKNWDGYLSNAEIQATTYIGVFSEGIKNLKGIGYFTALRELYCQNNSLTSLDVSQNTALMFLNCSGNQISGEAMADLVNSLRSLPSGTDGSFIVCDDKAKTDNTITPAQVKVATDKGWKVLKYDSKGNIVDYAGFDPIAINTTNFPDDNFRNYLLAQDYGKDGFLTESEIKCITELDVVLWGIKELTGIEYLTALTELFCYGNSLKSLDVSISKNTALTHLSCGFNSLKSLDVSKNTALTFLDCSRNNLESLDVSKNTALTELYCYSNQISGAAMTKLVNSLRSLPSGTEGLFYVCSDRYTPDNIITPAQVKIAKGKRWTVKKLGYNSIVMDYAGLGDVNGDGKIDQNDLEMIVKIIMGKNPADIGGYAGDLNMDGKTDAADIVVMVGILKSLGK